MQDHIFRKYDIRGIVGNDLVLSEVYTFGRALAAYFIRRAGADVLNTVAVARDGRSHSAHIQDELVRALRDSGIDVCCVGVCPTPVLYFGLHTLACEAGVMITASHNEKEYNGFKICYGKELINAHEISALRDLYKQKAQIDTAHQGALTEISLGDQYVAWLEKSFAHLKRSQINAVVDCGNGAAAAIVPQLVQRMGWSGVELLYETVDGEFPHRSPDPTQQGALQELSRRVVARKAACGVAFDGDADRMVAMTGLGDVLTGDIMLAVFAQEMVKHNPGVQVTFDAKCSQVLSTLLTQWGAQYAIAPTGHAFVKQKMVDTHALLAGELSCHFMFKDRYFGYDDGIYAMMRLFEIIVATQTSLDRLIETFPKSYTTGEVRIPCHENSKADIVHIVHAAFMGRPDVQISTLDGVRVETSYGWGIMRASNTQPVMSFSCEAMTPEGFENIKQDFYKALEPAFQNKSLSRVAF
jgi:phosphomannomutase/phosphoglucomutase